MESFIYNHLYKIFCERRPGILAYVNPTAIFGCLFFCLIGSIFAQTGAVHNRNLMIDGAQRSYLLYVPNDYSGQEEWPLVINFHGFGSNATNQMNIHSKMNAVADTGHFLIAYPEGLEVNNLIFGGAAPGWNVEGAYSASHDDIAFTDSLIDHVKADFNIDYGRVHATGWSNGSEMALYLACALENKIASVGGVSGSINFTLLNNNCFISRPFSMLLMHGAADPIVPFDGLFNLIPPAPLIPTLLANVNYCSNDSVVTELPDIVPGDSSTVTKIEYVNCYENKEVLFYRINNGGHTWPGSTPLPDSLGNENLDINASSEIWNFFKRNPHPSGGQPGEVLARSFMHGGVMRSYRLYVPHAYDGQGDWPLVVNYHGHGSSPDLQMLTHTKMNAIADTAHFLVAYPQGLPTSIPGFGAKSGWKVPGYTSNFDDVDFTDSLIQHIRNDFTIDSRRIHATGWSNGCTFAFWLAMKHPDVFASVGGVAGPMTFAMVDSFNTIRPFSTLLMHGTADPVTPFDGNNLFMSAPATQSFWAAQNNCSSDSVVTQLPDLVTSDNCDVTLIEYVNCDANTEVLFYRINNGGHPWPGTAPSFPPSFAGFTNRDITGSLEIWNFFKRNPHPGPVDDIVENDENLSKDFQLFQNYPNPFNPSTTIAFSLPQPGFVTLTIYNISGERVTTLISESLAAGSYQYNWNAGGMASGVYFYQLQTDKFTQTQKLVLLR